MKRILLTALVFLSMMVCFTPPTWGDVLADFKAGVEAAKWGDYDEAIRLYTKVIESGELSRLGLATAYHSRGYAWEKEGYYDNAIADFTEAIAIGELPKRGLATAYYYRGLAWYDKKDHLWLIKKFYDEAIDNAIADFTKAIGLGEELLRSELVLAYYFRGEAWYYKGDHKKAKADFDMTKKLDPTIPVPNLR